MEILSWNVLLSFLFVVIFHHFYQLFVIQRCRVLNDYSNKLVIKRALKLRIVFFVFQHYCLAQMIFRVSLQEFLSFIQRPVIVLVICDFQMKTVVFLAH